MNLVRIIKRLLSKVAYEFMHTATLVQGTLKDSSTSFQCVFVGSNHYRDYLIHKMYEDSPRILFQKRVWGIFGLHHLIERYRDQADLLIAVLPQDKEQLLKGRFQFKSYESVGHTMNITAPWEEIRQTFGKNPKETERKIKKNNLSYRISKTPEEFDMFYERMYVAHIQRQFGSLAQLKSYEVVRSYFDRGFLLFVLHDELPIAGLVAYPDGEKLAFRDVGLLDGDKAFAQIGAQSAIYYFTILHAKSLGLRSIDFRSSYPFLNDGVFRHKREWGSEISVNKELHSAVYFFTLGAPSQVAQFFKINPMVISCGPHLGVVIAPAGAMMEDDASNQKYLSNKYSAPGLCELHALSEVSGATKVISLMR